MNAAVHQKPELEVVVRLSIPAAQTVLDGLAKLPIERAAGIYMGLQNALDEAIQRSNAPPAAPPATPQPAPTDNTQPTQETQPT